jgi:hypothetical protein
VQAGEVARVRFGFDTYNIHYSLLESQTRDGAMSSTFSKAEFLIVTS